MTVALLAEGVDRNYANQCHPHFMTLSPSSRRAWIEIATKVCGRLSSSVALLAEGVDRNTPPGSLPLDPSVALLAEGVDRNNLLGFGGDGGIQSPSSRRAWIEIFRGVNRVVDEKVALLAEDVDRNEPAGWFDKDDFQSPSSRRAWIYTVIVLIRDLLSATPAVYR